MSETKLTKSFEHAFRGLREAFDTERNFRLMVFAVTVSVVVILVKPMPLSYRAALLLGGALLLAVELINSAIERAMNVLLPSSLEEIRKVKDMMAGAALVASVAWAIVFWWVLMS